jgi:hypothetical protein
VLSDVKERVIAKSLVDGAQYNAHLAQDSLSKKR